MCCPVLHASRHAEAALGRAPVSWWPPCQPAELATSSSAFTSILALKQSEAVRESEEGAGPRSQDHQMFSSFFVINRIASTQPTSTELSRYNVGWVWVGGEGADTQYGIH